MSKISFIDDSWEEFLWYITNDKSKIKKIKDLIKDIGRNGEREGIGHPEPLKDNLSGYYSRKIDEENRMVYRVENDVILIQSVKSHYGDK